MQIDNIKSILECKNVNDYNDNLIYIIINYRYKELYDIIV